MNHVIKNFKNHAIIPAYTPYFDAGTAIEIISECKKEQVQIYGIDAVKISEYGTQPFMEHSVDYSYVSNVWDEALTFIHSKQNLGLHFEIVMSDDE
ncbi:MAG: hypothetical protein QMB61_00675 [Clostridiaceae bacterium]